jgi:hypothetical protein
MSTELTDIQKQTVAAWVKEGCNLSEIQKRLTRDFQISLTYMDVRFLVLDLNLQIKEPERKAAPTPELGAPAGQRGAAQPIEPDSIAPPGGGVQVEVDRVTRSGAIVSGSVTFSDGVKATWSLDQMGRLALDAGGRRNYRPSEADVQAFQETLSQELQKHGF